MVSQIEDVAAYVRQAIQRAEVSQTETMDERMANLKSEISLDMLAGMQKQEAHLKEWAVKSGEGIERAVKETAERMAAEKIVLESRMAETLAQMNTALMKLSAAEQGVLPTLEPRFNKLETDIAELEAQRRLMISKMKANPPAEKGPEARAEESTAQDEPSPQPGTFGGTRIFSMSPKEQGGAEQVPWPTPEETRREAEARRSLGRTFWRSSRRRTELK